MVRLTAPGDLYAQFATRPVVAWLYATSIHSAAVRGGTSADGSVAAPSQLPLLKHPGFDAAVQKEKGSNLEVKGELFGIGNLFKLTAEKVSTQEIVHAQRQAEANFRIEEYDPEDLGELMIPSASLYIQLRTSRLAHGVEGVG